MITAFAAVAARPCTLTISGALGGYVAIYDSSGGLQWVRPEGTPAPAKQQPARARDHPVLQYKFDANRTGGGTLAIWGGCRSMVAQHALHPVRLVCFKMRVNSAQLQQLRACTLAGCGSLFDAVSHMCACPAHAAAAGCMRAG